MLKIDWQELNNMEWNDSFSKTLTLKTRSENGYIITINIYEETHYFVGYIYVQNENAEIAFDCLIKNFNKDLSKIKKDLFDLLKFYAYDIHS